MSNKATPIVPDAKCCCCFLYIGIIKENWQTKKVARKWKWFSHRKIGYYLNFNLHKIISSRLFPALGLSNLCDSICSSCHRTYDGHLINSELLPKVPCNNKHHKLFRITFTYGAEPCYLYNLHVSELRVGENIPFFRYFWSSR